MWKRAQNNNGCDKAGVPDGNLRTVVYKWLTRMLSVEWSRQGMVIGYLVTINCRPECRFH